MDNEQNTGQAQTIIVKSTKNVALATGLAFFFGPIGMCYATIKGAIIMFLVNFVVGGISAVWAYLAAKKYNERLLAEAL